MNAVDGCETMWCHFTHHFLQHVFSTSTVEERTQRAEKRAEDAERRLAEGGSGGMVQGGNVKVEEAMASAHKMEQRAQEVNFTVWLLFFTVLFLSFLPYMRRV